MSRPSSMFLVATLLAACATPGAAIAGSVPNEPVPEVDLARYAGLWYEQAHLPMFFQRKCVADTTAHYTPQDDGTIAVVNRCRTDDGSFNEAEGVARRVDGSSSRLEVRFAPGWLAWAPMVWGDYWVIALDADYQWAMVGSPDADYLWILSRTPVLDPAIKADLIERARTMGYPVDKLVDTPQGAASTAE